MIYQGKELHFLDFTRSILDVTIQKSFVTFDLSDGVYVAFVRCSIKIHTFPWRKMGVMTVAMSTTMRTSNGSCVHITLAGQETKERH